MAFGLFEQLRAFPLAGASTPLNDVAAGDWKGVSGPRPKARTRTVEIRRTFMKSTIAAIVVGLAMAAQGVSAQGGKQANLKVTASVLQNCVIRVTDLNFGDYDPVGTNATAAATATAEIGLTCTPGTAATISLEFGNQNSGSTRQMLGPTPSALLSYGLYKDGGYSQLWGTSPNDKLDAGLATDLSERTFPVYGSVLGGQSVPAGSYSDVVVVNVVF